MVPLGIMVLSSAFAFLLCWPSPVWGKGSEKILVSIAGKAVKLTCPNQKASWWKEKGGQRETLDCPFDCTIPDYQGSRHNGLYGCGVDPKAKAAAAMIYLHVKECPGCLEMDFWAVLGVIAADLMVTLGVLGLACHCSRKWTTRLSGGPTSGGHRRARPRGQREDHPPPVPNPDYEPIRKGQREVYAGLEPRAF